MTRAASRSRLRALLLSARAAAAGGRLSVADAGRLLVLGGHGALLAGGTSSPEEPGVETLYAGAGPG